LQELADRTGELVQLAVLETHVMRFVAKAEGKHRLRVLSTLGRAAVLHVSTVGKAWLATLPTNEALKIVSAAGMPRFTSHTIMTLARFRTELEKVRRQGYAVNEEEYLDGASSVGAAVRVERPRPHVVGAISVLGPTFRMPRETLAKIGQDVIDVAAQVAKLWPHMPA
jgi:DNA-binding IclR family transcriptional regulator